MKFRERLDSIRGKGLEVLVKAPALVMDGAAILGSLYLTKDQHPVVQAGGAVVAQRISTKARKLLGNVSEKLREKYRNFANLKVSRRGYDRFSYERKKALNYCRWTPSNIVRDVYRGLRDGVRGAHGMFSVYGRQIHRIDMNSWDNYCFDTNTFDLEKDKDLVGLDAINPLHQILAHRHMYVQDERGRKHRAFGHLLLEKGTSIATTATVLGAYAAFSPWLLLVPAATNAVDGLKQIALHFAAGAMIWDRAYHG